MMWYFWTQTHTKPLHGAKAKQANQPNHWATCQSTSTCFFHVAEWRQHRFICSTLGGAWHYSQSLKQSSAGHNTTMYFREQSVGAVISCDAESRNINLAEVRKGLTSYLGLPIWRLPLLHHPHFPCFPDSSLPPRAGPTISSHPGPHSLSLGWLPEHSLLALPLLP